MMLNGHPNTEPATVQINGFRVNAMVGDCSRLVERAQDLRRKVKKGTPLPDRLWLPAHEGWIAQLHRHNHLDLEVLIARRSRADGTQDFVVAIPGTDSWTDWWRYNLNVRRARTTGIPGRWHRGFMKAARWVWQTLLTQLGEHDRLTITGHSLGASTGLAVAAIALSLGFHIHSLVLFAPTRVCNECGRDWLVEKLPEPRLQAFLHGADIVPRLIPPFFGWARVPLYFIGTDHQLRRKSRGELRRAIGRRGVQSVRHHFMAHYRTWATRAVLHG